MAASGTPTAKLGLPQWNGSDPFLRSDFNTLMQTLDSTPGVTSVADEGAKTALAWNANKNGRLVVVRSTKRVYEWQSPNWIEYGGLPQVWGDWDGTDVTVGASGTYTKNDIISGTLARPSTLSLNGQLQAHSQSGRFSGYVYIVVVQGGVTQECYGGRGIVDFSSASAGALDTTVACQGIVSLNAGSFTAGIKFSAGSSVSGTAKIYERSLVAHQCTDGGSF